MLSNGSGLKMLILHLLVSYTGWVLIDTKSFGLQLMIATAISLFLIILWHIAIRRAGKAGFSNSVVVSLYFTVPSLISGILYYYSYLQQDQTSYVFFDLIWSIVNYPFTFGCTVLQIRSPLTDSIWVQIALPIAIMNLLLAVSLVESIAKKKSIIHNPKAILAENKQDK